MRKSLNHILAAMAAICALMLIAGGCGGDDPGGGGGGGGGGGTSSTPCEQLNVSGGDLNSAVFWPEGDTYGVNSFYVWELDYADGTYRYHGTDRVVTSALPSKNWVIPPTLWSAIRFNLDGYDPYHFLAADPFHLWYLPFTPGASWQSKTGARNDGTCPADDHLIGGRQRCQGKNQLDPNAPSLVRGKTYLFRMLMIIPTGYSNGENRIQSCYETMEDY